MPLYEYHCEKCDKVFEALRPIKDSDVPAPCPSCGALADRIMPTTFQSMVFKGGWRQRAPFHQSAVRSDQTGKRAVAPVKPKTSARSKVKPSRTTGAKKG